MSYGAVLPEELIGANVLGKFRISLSIVTLFHGYLEHTLPNFEAS